MLFNSFAFIFVFLPATCAVFFWIAPRSRPLAALWLTIASLAFYGWWNPIYVLLLCASIAFNFMAAKAILGFDTEGHEQAKKVVLIGAVFVDLSVLAYYKYAGFFVRTIAGATGADWSIESVALPLGISFFTFTQISFLVDTWRGEVRKLDPIHFALFVTYFPHLIAGPILHHREMIPQFSAESSYRLSADNIAAGLTMFAAGLFKKVVLADSVAKFADPVFGAAAGAHVSFVEAWGGALAYTMQIYFDFSGYSDMAIGLSMLFGIRIPLNFNSPYKAESIVDFWRRWHISLSNFLRDYLYISLGGNRHGPARRYANLMITMLLGGLWHGAGWTFVIWGGLHGLYLVINHLWNMVTGGQPAAKASAPRRWSARLLTFLAVIVGWVFFRAESLDSAMSILRGMAGLNGVILPETWAGKLGPLGAWLGAHNVRFASLPLYAGASQIALIAVLMGIVWFVPNTTQWMEKRDMVIGKFASLDGAFRRFAWQPNFGFALAVAGVITVCLLTMYFSSGSEFIYYNF